MIPYLPLHQISATYEPALSEAALRVIRSGHYLLGPETEAFEKEFAAYIGVAHCVGVGNGLDALTLALQAMSRLYDWPAGSEVIVPDMTFIATAEAVVRAGLVPVAADVDSHALLTAETAEKVLTPRTRAVVPVHLYGCGSCAAELANWAADHGLVMLEDAAQAHGASCGERKAGAWGKAAAFSFYPGKNLGALGDGGAVVTDDTELAGQVRMLANYGAKRKYFHEAPGSNSRLDELQAAMLRIKLRRLDADNAQRRRVARAYAEGIRSEAVALPYDGDTTQSVFHIYPLRCPQRDALAHHLAQQGIQTLIHYPFTLSGQPALAPFLSLRKPTSPSWAETWAREELSLPIHPLLTPEETDLICQTVNQFPGE